MSAAARATRQLNDLEKMGLALANIINARHPLPKGRNFMTVHDDVTGLDFDLRRKDCKIFVTLHNDPRAPAPRAPTPTPARRAPTPARRAPTPARRAPTPAMLSPATDDDDDEAKMDALEALMNQPKTEKKTSKKIVIVRGTHKRPVSHSFTKDVKNAIKAYNEKGNIWLNMKKVTYDIEHLCEEQLNLPAIEAIYHAVVDMNHRFRFEIPKDFGQYERAVKIWSEFSVSVQRFGDNGFECVDDDNYVEEFDESL